MANDPIIKAEHLTFCYPDEPAGHPPVLDDISLEIKTGKQTAVVGMSGSGKTTIINLLARFWDVQQGAIKVGGKSIRTVSYEYLLHNLSFVFQDVMLFQDTVFNNIRLGNPCASMDEVVAAAKRARCHEFIMQLENGYDTVLGENYPAAKSSGYPLREQL